MKQILEAVGIRGGISWGFFTLPGIVLFRVTSSLPEERENPAIESD